MSLSIDDLVSSLSANHIGEEALQLAALQAQLAQTLFSQHSSSAQNVPRRGPAQPMNSPLARTPSSSFSLEPGAHWPKSFEAMGTRQRRGTLSEEREPGIDEMEEDEQMVEDMLSSPPASASAATTHFSPSEHQSSTSPASGYPLMHMRRFSASATQEQFPSPADLSPPNSSIFTTTDPFYLAQVQATQNSQTSVFTQAGRPSPHSPFLAHQFQTSYHPIQPTDQHNFFAATAATAFSH
ncbi:hypothetical protein CERSUDRAFT_91729 [Gelatoporia subvermispora B]|uniref:Uncharacterized protein n=1 Tax=Ceriporiopsis subvermispora (strain B) TaxID=914234 RepID=M2RRA5_CERS8|nr:hypothetical protein CERSUDRAFT_91729 [Gelatoporia subvermispora B]